MSISIILRTKNNKSTIRQCLSGILRQTVKPNLIIVDASTDETPEIIKTTLKGYKYKLIRQDKPGIGYATKLGIYASKDDIIITTDADTVLSPRLVEHAQKILNTRKDISLVGATTRSLSNKYITSKVWEALTCDKIGKPIGRFMAFRKSDFLKSKGLSVDGIPAYYEDYIIAKRLSKYGKFLILDEPVYTSLPSTTQIISFERILGASLLLISLFSRKYRIILSLSGLSFLLSSYTIRSITLDTVKELLGER